jgi:hypothetical protein
MKVFGEIPNLVFIAVVNDTDEKLFTGVSDNGDIVSPMSLLPVKNYRRCR